MNKYFTNGFAVIIGTGSSDILKTKDDAIGLEKILIDPERCAYPKGNVKLLTCEDSSRKNILNALESLSNKATI